VALQRIIAAALLRRFPDSRAKGIARYWRAMERLQYAQAAFVSFPKSGRTFVRVMLARLYQQQFGIDERELLKFSTLVRSRPEVPRLLFTHAGDAMRTPDQITIDRDAFRHCKVILLARHPGDTVVSRYFHCKHRTTDRARQKLAQQPLEEFIWTQQGGIPSIVEFLNQWADLSRHKPEMMIIRYEDIVREPRASLADLARFIGLRSDPDQICNAVEFARFDRLKETERLGYFRSKRMGAGRDGHADSFKVRAGASGGFRSSLGEDAQRAVQGYVADHLDSLFGYEQRTRRAVGSA
jgi:hypothetical protein